MSCFWKTLCCCCCREREYESVQGSNSSSSASELLSSVARQETQRPKQRLIKAYAGEGVISRSRSPRDKRIGMQSGEDSDTLYEVAGPAPPADIKIVNPAYHPYRDTDAV
ncbi:uncharacterized protein LOC134191496 [Corticium candelabrum]|uniref:uncharacterized protein LOC134191496 n=1 Tax=Corticium candelabrum TaxID=121492 RepID=UPI002E270C02|nr:uncharacterized protein LOC134191496 [Corticium candelabrum]